MRHFTLRQYMVHTCVPSLCESYSIRRYRRTIHLVVVLPFGNYSLAVLGITRGKKVSLPIPIHPCPRAGKIKVRKDKGVTWVVSRKGRGRVEQPNDHPSSLQKGLLQADRPYRYRRWVKLNMILGRSYPTTQLSRRIAGEQQATGTRVVSPRSSAHDSIPDWKINPH